MSALSIPEPFARPIAATLLAAAALICWDGTAPAAAAEASPWSTSLALPVGPVAGVPAAAAPDGLGSDVKENDVDTEHIFGFSMGSDIGAKGERELEIENTSGIGKRTGSYFSFGSLNLVKFTLTDNFRVAPAVLWGANRITGVAGFDDRQQAAIEGGAVELRYKLLDRDVMPFGLTLHAQPGYNRTDEATGLRVEQYTSEFAVLMDKELIKDRLWAAANLWYGLGSTRELARSAWTQNSDVAVHAALSYRLLPILVMGGEIRYLRAYEGLGLDRFAGEAVYVGPTFNVKIANNAGLSGTFNVQVAGKAAGDPARLDLINFERYQAMLRFNVLF